MSYTWDLERHTYTDTHWQIQRHWWRSYKTNIVKAYACTKWTGHFSSILNNGLDIRVTLEIWREIRTDTHSQILRHWWRSYKLTLLKHMHVHIQVCKKKIDTEIYIMSTTRKYEYNDSWMNKFTYIKISFYANIVAPRHSLKVSLNNTHNHTYILTDIHLIYCE